MSWAKIDLFVWGLVAGLVISDFAYDHVNGSTYLLIAIFSIKGSLRLINLFLARLEKRETARGH